MTLVGNMIAFISFWGMIMMPLLIMILSSIVLIINELKLAPQFLRRLT